MRAAVGNRQRALPSEVLAGLYQQLYQLDRAGIAPLEALAKVHSTPAQERIAATLRYIQRGDSLAQAGRRAGLFVGFDATLIAAAEQSGIYPFDQLARLHEAQRRRRGLIISRSVLPLAVLLLALLVRPLPDLVAGRIDAAGFLLSSIGVFALLLGLLLIAWKLPGWLRRYGLGGVWDRTILQLPLVGTLVRRRNMLEFSRALGTLHRAGVAMFEALPQAIGVVANSVLQQRLYAVEQTLRSGATLSDALHQSPDLDPGLLALVASGESAGSIDRMLLHYAELEEQEVSAMEDALAQWVPRILYLAAALWMAVTIVSSTMGGSLSTLEQMGL